VFNDIWKSTALTLITAIAAVITCGLQPSLHVESASVRNLDGTLAMAMIRPIRLSASAGASMGETATNPHDGPRAPRQASTAEMTWSD
jgi:hypothetical protein